MHIDGLKSGIEIKKWQMTIYWEIISCKTTKCTYLKYLNDLFSVQKSTLWGVRSTSGQDCPTRSENFLRTLKRPLASATVTSARRSYWAGTRSGIPSIWARSSIGSLVHAAEWFLPADICLMFFPQRDITLLGSRTALVWPMPSCRDEIQNGKLLLNDPLKTPLGYI